MSKLSQIISGWANYVFEKPGIKMLAHQRAAQCSICPHAKHSKYTEFLTDDIKEVEGMVCELCSCPLSTKLRSPESKCDVGKW